MEWVEAIEAIRTRRSHPRLTDPAPTDADLASILEAGIAGPDHGELEPVRLTLIRGQAMDSLGELLRDAYFARCAVEGVEAVAAKAEKERTKLRRAPLVIVVQAVHQQSTKIPWQDQRDAAAAASMNILLATHALGYGAIWRTGDICEDAAVKSRLGLRDEDAIAGFIYVGTVVQPKEPRHIDINGRVSEFEATR
jgi:nitroreductase